MSHEATRSAARPEPDRLLVDIATYATDFDAASDLAYETA
jgi:hypothetical protein